MKVVIDAAVAEEGCLTAPQGFVFILITQMGSDHIRQGSSALPNQRDNVQYGGLSGSPDSHAPGSQSPSRIAILVHFPAVNKDGVSNSNSFAPLNSPVSAETV